MMRKATPEIWTKCSESKDKHLTNYKFGGQVYDFKEEVTTEPRLDRPEGLYRVKRTRDYSGQREWHEQRHRGMEHVPSGPSTSIRAEPRGHRGRAGAGEETGNRT